MNDAGPRLISGGRASVLLVNAVTVTLLLFAGWRAAPAVAEAQDRGAKRALAEAAADRPTLLVMFQERDCTAAGRFVTDWRRVTGSDAARVIAVPVNVRSAAALDEVIAQFPPDFDVRPELEQAATALLRQLRVPMTPVAVLLDRTGRPRMLIPGIEASPNQLEVQAAITTYLNMLRRT